MAGYCGVSAVCAADGSAKNKAPNNTKRPPTMPSRNFIFRELHGQAANHSSLFMKLPRTMTSVPATGLEDNFVRLVAMEDGPSTWRSKSLVAVRQLRQSCVPAPIRPAPAYLPEIAERLE